jgi:hypothetical protein
VVVLGFTESSQAQLGISHDLVNNLSVLHVTRMFNIVLVRACHWFPRQDKLIQSTPLNINFNVILTPAPRSFKSFGEHLNNNDNNNNNIKKKEHQSP